MVLGLLTAIAACPAIVGTTEAVRQGQRTNAKEKHRGVKSNLIISCARTSSAGRYIDGCSVVLHDNKLWIGLPNSEGRTDLSLHPFAGYFLPYPEKNWGRKGEGMVSTICDEPPQLNWIYVDEETYEVKYGLRTDSEDHIVGPWDCTPLEKRITLEGWEGFMAVELDGAWALYFDRDDDGLQEKIFEGRILEVELTRKERRKGRDDEG
ncbi:hypothetical protein N7463_008659 [Penicillium fimorum]|uniref:Uncharacterized protein n=1 Tax=Penicillium fimorum TaxID=1882269 RepID=A0A9X0C3G8_9EURO|nr:hypothetical protein N7463_008659 [Penicillium fimorum]